MINNRIQFKKVFTIVLLHTIFLLSNCGNQNSNDSILGCNDSRALNYNREATINDGSCITQIPGCTNPDSINYNPAANSPDGSCRFHIMGCMDPDAFNYNAAATKSGHCISKIIGCTNTNACNFNENANADDGTCMMPGPCDQCSLSDDEKRLTDGTGTLIDGDMTNDGLCDVTIQGQVFDDGAIIDAQIYIDSNKNFFLDSPDILKAITDSNGKFIFINESPLTSDLYLIAKGGRLLTEEHVNNKRILLSKVIEPAFPSSVIAMIDQLQTKLTSNTAPTYHTDFNYLTTLFMVVPDNQRQYIKKAIGLSDPIKLDDLFNQNIINVNLNSSNIFTQETSIQSIKVNQQVKNLVDAIFAIIFKEKLLHTNSPINMNNQKVTLFQHISTEVLSLLNQTSSSPTENNHLLNPLTSAESIFNIALNSIQHMIFKGENHLSHGDDSLESMVKAIAERMAAIHNQPANPLSNIDYTSFIHSSSDYLRVVDALVNDEITMMTFFNDTLAQTGCLADTDYDSICDSVDDCVGVLDECGICNGDGMSCKDCTGQINGLRIYQSSPKKSNENKCNVLTICGPTQIESQPPTPTTDRECSCLDGFIKNGSQCIESSCPAHATCENGVATCNSGFIGTLIWQESIWVGSCEDLNECNLDLNNCNVHANCLNTIGSFNCECKAGFNGDGYSCSDINECVVNNGGCGDTSSAICINDIGSYLCIDLYQ